MTGGMSRVRCPGCGASLVLPEQAAGRRFRCPKCAGPVEAELELLEPRVQSPPPVAPVRSHRAAEPPPPPAKKYALQLDTVFLYPFSSFGGILFLVLATPFWAVLRADVVPFSGILQWFVGGYIAVYMFEILYRTSMGKRDAPAAPALTEWGEVVANFFRFFGATLVSFAPAVALLVYAVVQEREPFESAGFLVLLGFLGLVGALYYPMALLLIGFSQSLLAAFNYAFGVRGILRMPGDYLICCLFFVGTFAAYVLLEVFWVAAAAGGELAGLLVAQGVTTFVVLYLYAVQMRALGLLYLTNKERLGWFR